MLEYLGCILYYIESLLWLRWMLWSIYSQLIECQMSYMWHYLAAPSDTVHVLWLCVLCTTSNALPRSTWTCDSGIEAPTNHHTIKLLPPGLWWHRPETQPGVRGVWYQALSYIGNWPTPLYWHCVLDWYICHVITIDNKAELFVLLLAIFLLIFSGLKVVKK